MQLAKEGFNLIEQCEGLNAWPLVKALLKSAAKVRATEVVLYSDRPVRLEEWSFMGTSAVHTIDMNANMFKDLNSKSRFFAQLEHYLKSVRAEQSMVVLDCLESLVMCHGQVCSIQMLHRLFTAGCKCSWVLIASVEELPVDFLAHLRSIAHKVHRLSLEDGNKHPVYQEIRHNAVRYTWDFQIDSSYDFTSTKRRVEVKKPIKQTEPATASVPAVPRDIESGVSFRLSLSEKEWEAKSKLQLPYKKEAEARNEAATAPSSKVYYIADADDDVDDEDPDEDLDF